MAKYKIHKFPKSRIATIDVCERGKKKHHVAAFLEIDVTSGKVKMGNVAVTSLGMYGKINGWFIPIFTQYVLE